MTEDPLIAKYGLSRNGHSIFAPSGSASWLNCSGSLLASLRHGDNAGYEAAEGTVAHSMAERWSKTGERPSDMVGKRVEAQAGGSVFDIEVTDNMLYHVERFVDWCREVPGDHYYEQRVDLSELLPIPKQGGTADHFACQPFVLTITDLKYGTGVRVYAQGNTQALLYASGVFLAWDWIYSFQTIVIRICQPRLDVFEVWEITRQELLDFMEYVKVRAKAAWQPNAPRTPSHKACQWCNSFERCPARMALIDQIIDGTAGFDEDLEDDQGPVTYEAEALKPHSALVKSAAEAVELVEDDFTEDAIGELSTPALAYAYGFRQTMEKWFKRIGEELLDRAEKGYSIPFWTLSEGRKNRRFKDAASAKTWILSQYPEVDENVIAPRKLVSVKKVETAIKLATKKKPAEVTSEIGALVEVVQSKRSLVPFMDDRPEIDDIDDGFDVEDDDL